jgi:hypothetical protein
VAKRKAGKAKTRQEALLLQQLHGTLSTDEIQHVLASSLLALDDAGRRRLLDRLEPDTRSPLVALLDLHDAKRSVADGGYAAARGDAAGRKGRGTGRDASAVEVQPGRAKVREQWRQLWNEWNECLCESNTDGGRYV